MIKFETWSVQHQPAHFLQETRYIDLMSLQVTSMHLVLSHKFSNVFFFKEASLSRNHHAADE